MVSRQPLALSTTSMRAFPRGGAVERILAAALRAVDPYQAVRQALKLDGTMLTVAGRRYNLEDYRRVLVVGAGKAAAPMLQAVSDGLGTRLAQAAVVTKEGHTLGALPGDNLRMFEAGHPVPDERGLRAARAIIELLNSAGEHDLVICLVSGGGSALLVSPSEGIALADLQAMTTSLLRCGASINQINTLRKHLDGLKGGGLARLAAPATLITLLLSDVVGDPLDVIASGLTVPDPTNFQDCLQILARYQIETTVPPNILRHLQLGAAAQIAETPKPGDPLFARVTNQVIASNALAANAALGQARTEGFNTLLLTTFLQGEARQAGVFLAGICRQAAATGQPLARPACMLAGGETTVTLRGNGLGGRNQELALGAVSDLAGLENVLLVALATDGGDGPSDAAGAVVSGETLARAARLNLDPQAFLAANDAYHFFQPLGDLLQPGPTRTNVNDLAFLFVG
jgi:hydroxypyruvate reductase